MSKKELRKELELLLVKSIDAVLSKKNSTAAKKIRKTTFDASKIVAKKFYKSLKTETKITVKKGAKNSVKKAKPTVRRAPSKAKSRK